VREPREGGATSLEISPEPDRLLDLGDVVVPLGGTLAGVVRGPDGTRRGGARITVRPALATSVLSESDVGWAFAETTSREDGRWEVGALPPGSVAVFARGEPGEWASLSPVDVPGGRTREDVDLALRTGRTVEGTVTSHDGTPAVGARVYALGRGSPVWTATTDATGRFRLMGVDSGATVIGAHDRALRLFAHAPLGPDASADLRFPPVGVIAGRVVAAETSRPLPEFLLAAHRDEEDLLIPMIAAFVAAWTGEGGHLVPQRFVDADGAFRIEAPAGSVTVVVDARGRMPFEAAVDVKGGGTTEVGTLVLAPRDLAVASAPREDGPEPSRGLRVRVLDSTGAEAADVTVTATAVGGRSASAETDARGRATLEVSADRWAVAVASAPLRKALADRRRDAFDSAAGVAGTVLVDVSRERGAEVVLRLPPLATVSGRLRVDGKAERGMLRLEVATGGEGSPRAVPADATGAFTIRHVETGDYRLHVDGHEERDGVNPVSFRVGDATEYRIDLSLPRRPAPAAPQEAACGDGKCG
jgi:hypothetical protein